MPLAVMSAKSLFSSSSMSLYIFLNLPFKYSERFRFFRGVCPDFCPVSQYGHVWDVACHDTNFVSQSKQRIWFGYVSVKVVKGNIQTLQEGLVN
jgi:hypothetical protein